MFYLDGSVFFFDIEEAFSRLIGVARGENAGTPGDPFAKGLCGGFAEVYGTKPEFVRAGADYKTLLRGILPVDTAAVIPEYDCSAEAFRAAFPDNGLSVVSRTKDMKIDADALLAAAEKEPGSVIFLTNPACPASLELSVAEVRSLTSAAKGLVLVDESHMADPKESVLKDAGVTPNLVVLKKLWFGGNPVYAAGADLPEFDGGISASNQAAAEIIFKHPAVLKTAQRKLMDSRESLYLRIKKLAVKYRAPERLYRTKADCVFFRTDGAERIAAGLEELGIAVRRDGDYLCVFAGNRAENDVAVESLETVLKEME
ncbi:MAG TPA: hypothetical protein PKY19_00035 [Oscillospiraceae bacterium]|nr:hypothetical protein [Oscillospiraceae bacterium]HXK76866.1 hypothetical protein [Oscillospiraceae bacterium]